MRTRKSQRSRVSRGSNALVQRLLGIDLTDPMSGHFMIRRDALEAVAPSLSTQGFKILLDILATARGTVIRIQKKGPGGLEMLVQHDGFVGIYSHFGMVMPAFAEGKRTVAAGEKLGVVGNIGLTTGAHLYFEMDFAGKPVDPAPYLGIPRCNGEAHQASNDRPDTEGKIIGGRKYYLIFPPGE